MASNNGRIQIRKRKSDKRKVYLIGAILAFAAWRSGLLYYALLEVNALTSSLKRL